MARIRTIKPDFWEDETVGSLSRDARLLFIATFNMADDEGLLRWTSSYIKAQAFIYDDDVTVETAEVLMGELTEAGLVFPYHGGKLKQRLALVVNFRKHQKINRPQASKLPAPSLQSLPVRQMYARRDGWRCHICNGPINEQPSADERLNLSIDHLTPRSDGGEDYPSNVRVAHLSCNKSRRNKPLAVVGDPFTESLTESFTEPLIDVGANPAPARALRRVNNSLPEGNGREGKGKGRTSATAPRRAESDEGFDSFWQTYPRKVGKDAARKAWDKAIRSAAAEDITAGAKRYASQREGQDPQFTAHPSSWLNAGRWKDETDRDVANDWRRFSEQ